MSTKITSCQKCGKIKTWQGGDIECPFQESETFSADNWNCGGLSGLRNLLNRALYEDIQGIALLHYEGQTQAIIDLHEIPFQDDNSRLGMYVTWYKDRGRTEAAFILYPETPPKAATFEEINSVVDYYKNSTP